MAASSPAVRRRPATRSGAKRPTAQAQKSELTRARLVEATVRCLVRYGYAQTTTPLVAREAGMSRGAMLHHFENGRALIKATIEVLHEKRLRGLRRAAQANAHDAGSQVRVYWQQVQSPAFVAMRELAAVARTNADLAEVLYPLQHEYDERYRSEAASLYPEWQSSPDGFALALNLTRIVVEGLAARCADGTLSGSEVEATLTFLERRIDDLNPASRREAR